MHHIHRPTEAELMREARRTLERRRAEAACVPASVAGQTAQNPPVNRHAEAVRLGGQPGFAPEHTAAATEDRRWRSLQSCHRFALTDGADRTVPRGTGGYVPELAARLENDPDISDGARRCARKIAEETYRRNRPGRCLNITVSYLARGLGRCRRTVQRYLGQLEAAGYIRAEVIAGERSRMCVGVVIHMLGPLFPRHHKQSWPQKCTNPGATEESQNQSHIDSYRAKGRLISRKEWALKCMDGVFRALMQILPPFDPIRATG